MALVEQPAAGDCGRAEERGERQDAAVHARKPRVIGKMRHHLAQAFHQQRDGQHAADYRHGDPRRAQPGDERLGQRPRPRALRARVVDEARKISARAAQMADAKCLGRSFDMLPYRATSTGLLL